LVLAPATPLGNQVAIVADGSLQLVPFGALPLSNGHPLVSAAAVAVLPSASALAAVRVRVGSREPARRLAAVLADPVYSAGDPRVGRATAPLALAPRLVRAVEDVGLKGLPRLPGTRREADLLVRLGRDREVFRAVGFDVTRETVTGGALDSARIVHLATHALVDVRHPELSGLVLSLVDVRGAPRDGFLQAHEILGLKMDAELVVLSACRTAIGKEVRGEGLIGLSRAFMAAGVPRMVASLWSVPDSATAELMSRFYRGLIEEGHTPSEALRRAQDALRRERRWADPNAWAGFVFQGDWR
jgi:CHAT domain-containing protein